VRVTQAGERRSVVTRSRLVIFILAIAVAVLSIAAPASAERKKSHRERGKVTVKAKTRAHRTSAKNPRGKGKDRRLVELTTLVATVDGISVAPDQEPEVQGTQFHRPEAPTTNDTQAAGVAPTQPAAANGMLGFLLVALLLASLAAWLIRQVGPLRE
jgi:hypothetical protein